MQTGPHQRTLSSFIKRAARRRRCCVFLQSFPRALALALAGVFVSLLISTWRGYDADFGVRLLLAIVGVQIAILYALARALSQTESGVVDLFTREVHAGELIRTAAGLSEARRESETVALLCEREALRKVETLQLSKLYPFRRPRLALAGALFICIFLTSLLLPFGWFGASGFMGANPYASAKATQTTAAAGGDPKSNDPKSSNKSEDLQNETKPPEDRPESKPESKPVPTDITVPKPQPLQPQPQSQPSQQSGSTEKQPPKSEEPDPFVAKPKLIPIDPRDGMKSNRESLVLEQKELLQNEGPAARAVPRKIQIDAAAANELERAAERALRAETATDRERAFVKKYFAQLKK
ncbi:MAG: hypothetical protein ACKVS6_07640 [Planctomycetota bacterium]